MKRTSICPVCGNSETRKVYRVSLEAPAEHPIKNGYEVYACPRCDFGFAAAGISNVDLVAYYADLAKYADTQFSAGGVESEFTRIRSRNVADQLIAAGIGPSSRVLDIGCATGGLLKELKSRGIERLVGIDPAMGCVDYVRSLGIESHVGVIGRLPKLEGAFDLIILSHVVEHLLDPVSDLREVGKLLSERGLLYVETPDIERSAAYEKTPFQEFSTEHLNYLGWASTINISRRAGLEPELIGRKTLRIGENLDYPCVFSFLKRASLSVRHYDMSSGPEIFETLQAYVRHSESLLLKIGSILGESVSGEYAIWGAGQLTYHLLAQPFCLARPPSRIYDNNRALWGRRIGGIEVVSPDTGLHVPAIVIGSVTHAPGIAKSIRQRGFAGFVVSLA